MFSFFVRVFSKNRHIIWKSMSTWFSTIDPNIGPEKSTRTAYNITIHKFLFETVSKRITSLSLSFSISQKKWIVIRLNEVLSDQIHWNARNQLQNWNVQNGQAVYVDRDHMNHYCQVMRLCRPLIYHALVRLVWHQYINRYLGVGIASKCVAAQEVNGITVVDPGKNEIYGFIVYVNQLHQMLNISDVPTIH